MDKRKRTRKRKRKREKYPKMWDSIGIVDAKSGKVVKGDGRRRWRKEIYDGSDRRGPRRGSLKLVFFSSCIETPDGLGDRVVVDFGPLPIADETDSFEFPLGRDSATCLSLSVRFRTHLSVPTSNIS